MEIATSFYMRNDYFLKQSLFANVQFELPANTQAALYVLIDPPDCIMIGSLCEDAAYTGIMKFNLPCFWHKNLVNWNEKCAHPREEKCVW